MLLFHDCAKKLFTPSFDLPTSSRKGKIIAFLVLWVVFVSKDELIAL